MALSSLRLRRALSLSSHLSKTHSPPSPFPSPPPLSSSATNSITALNPTLYLNLNLAPSHLPFQSRLFRSSAALLSSSRFSRQNNFSRDDDIGPDAILFEGCDYNHWLITMDFPKDPAPTREEMIDTYLQTLAKVVGSYEEAKKKMYAFSTTTYQGFQCLVTEEESEKFKDLPGVVFVLPDSYIDPVNKEYGGDKYEDGVITPRPPPVQYGRPQRRYNNRDFNQNQPRQPMPNQQHSPSFGNQRPMYGDARNVEQPQNSPMQPRYGQPGAGDRSDPMPLNNAPRGQGPMPSYQANYNQNEQGYYNQQNSPAQPRYGPPGLGDRRDPMPLNDAPRGQGPLPSYQATYNQNEQRYDNPQGGRFQPERRDSRGYNRDNAPPQGPTYGHGLGGNYNSQGGRLQPEQRDSRGDNRDNAPPRGPTYRHGPGGSYGQVADGNYGQGGGNYGQGAGSNFSQEGGTNYREGAQGNYGQGAGGNYGQGAGGNYGQGVGDRMQGTGFGYGGNREEHRFDQRNNMQGEQGTYAPLPHTGQTK